MDAGSRTEQLLAGSPLLRSSATNDHRNRTSDIPGHVVTQAAALVDPSGMEPPPRPSNWVIFKVMLRKHIFISKKRRRVLTSVWPVIMYCGVIIGLYFAFRDISNLQTRAMLFAIVVPLELQFGINAVLTTAIIEVVSEKESKMKVIQEIYGLTTAMYWLSWGAYFSLVSVVSVTVIFIFMYVVQPVMSGSNPLLVFVILTSAYIQQFEFAAIAAVFFDKVQLASSMAAMLNLLMTMGASAAQAWLQGKSRIIWYLVSLLPGINVFNGLSAIMWAQCTYTCNDGVCHTGLGFDNLFNDKFCLVKYSEEGCPPDASKLLFPFGETILLIIIDVLLYGFLAWYLEHVWQGEFGAAKPLTFCFNPAYMCPRRLNTRSHQSHSQGQNSEVVALSISHLRKVFSKKVAVDDMTLDVYGGEIFALLGHNGAGKTTAINCIVGLIPLTAGGAIVNGFDVVTDIDNARWQLSICPQDNPFYDVFTVRQHMVFFAKLRGVSEARVEDRMGCVLSALGMQDKVEDLCKNLSGGQKRRLWVATALVGESPIAFLDEPTSGMDPASRRELWDLLLAMKAAGRTIIFTTHYLEEADVLADRKAVMARGKVQALGTSRDLKMHYGLGYHLQVELQQGASDEQIAEIAELVRSYVQCAKVEDAPPEERAQAFDAPCLARFTLPFSEVGQFGPLLLDLDKRKDQSPPHVRNYSLAMTSLEEVFMKLGRQAEEEAASTHNVDFREVDMETSVVNPRAEASFRRSAKARTRMLILALKNRRSLNAIIIVPVILMVVSCFTSFGSSASSSLLPSAIYPPMAFGISILPFSFMLIKDKVNKSKHVSLAQGLSVKAYWVGNFAACYMCSLLVSVIYFGLVMFSKPKGIYGPGLFLLAVETFLYPIGLILFSYNVSIIFSTEEYAARILPLMNMVAGTIPTVAVCMLWPLQEPLSTLAKGLHILMSFLNPVYAMPGQRAKRIFLNCLRVFRCFSTSALAKGLHILMSFLNPVYAMPGVIVTMGLSSEAGQDFSASDYFDSWCALPVYGTVFVVILYGSNLYFQDSRSYRSRPGDINLGMDNSRKDSDVLAEEARIATEINPAALANEAANYSNLSHTYRSKIARQWVQTPAVRGISLGVRKGECFGLLGPNGAGKTTTLAVLTGEVRPPTSGRVAIFGHDMATAAGMKAAYELLGVCPQVDPIWESLTGLEHLLFYGRIKGVPEAELKHTVGRIFHRLGLEPADQNKPAGQYSGGMKRKLSLGIALIGQSSLMFLDEPSAAVDAGAKRHLWKVIKRRAPGQTVVLTTHSMEEAEALCDRIAIQVKGQLRCLGTPNHIKNTYGSGYQLEVFCRTLQNGDSNNHLTSLLNFMQDKLSPLTQLLECHSGRCVFQLPQMGQGKDSLTLGKVFSELHTHKEAMGITDYSIAQPSLEQVFIRFAQEQDEAEDVELEEIADTMQELP